MPTEAEKRQAELEHRAEVVDVLRRAFGPARVDWILHEPTTLGIAFPDGEILRVAFGKPANGRWCRNPEPHPPHGYCDDRTVDCPGVRATPEPRRS